MLSRSCEGGMNWQTKLCFWQAAQGWVSLGRAPSVRSHYSQHWTTARLLEIWIGILGTEHLGGRYLAASEVAETTGSWGR